MSKSTQATPRVRHPSIFGIVGVLTSASIAILIATGAVNPHPTPKLAYVICGATGLTGAIQLAYTIVLASRS